MQDLKAYTLVKLAVFPAILALLPCQQAFIATIALIITYRYIIAAILGLQVMAIMDLNTFTTSSKSPLNCVSITPVSQSKPEQAYEVFGKHAKTHVKMRCKIVEVFGDYYYKEMGFDEVMKTCVTILPGKTIKNKQEMEKFFGEKISEVFSLDRPQWHLWVQLNYEGEGALLIYK